MNLQDILTPPKTVAMIGLSDKPYRPSYIVAEYLINNGYTIIPVNPTLKKVFGQKSYHSIADIPQEITIDVVDIFRKSKFVPIIINEVIKSGRKPFIWMQEGIISLEGKELAEVNGLNVVMDKCIKKEHFALQN